LFPIGGTPNAEAFFEAYLAAPIVLGFFLFWKILKRTRWVKTMEIDLVSGRREMNLRELRMQEIEEQSHWNPIQKYVFLFLWDDANIKQQGLFLALLGYVSILSDM
jgi:amino acid permease